MSALDTLNPSGTTERRPELLTEREVAELFRVTRRTIHRWAVAGTLQPVRVRGITRYRSADVAALIDPENDASPVGEPGSVATSAAGAGDDGKVRGVDAQLTD